MIDEIFELIMKEARTREDPSLYVNVLTVYSELSEKVFQAMTQFRVEDIKRTRLTFRRKQE